MIQRIQTVFLLLSAILSGLLLFGNLLEVSADGNIFQLTLSEFLQIAPKHETISSFYYLTVIVAIACVLSFFAIFLYKKRKLQMRICMFAVILMFGVTLLLTYNIFSIYSTPNQVISYSIKITYPPLIIIFLLLAYRGIFRDELLIRSLNRLR